MSEESLVRELGGAIGYGRMMQLAEQEWRKLLARSGHAGGEHTTGPCASSMVPCQCRTEKEPQLDANGHCDWCCGAGRVTKHVRAQQGIRALIERSSLGTVPMPQHTKLMSAVGELVETISGVLDEVGAHMTRERRRELHLALEVVKQAAAGG